MTDAEIAISSPPTMNTKIGLLLLLPAIGLSSVWAQQASAPSLDKGKVLLLTSERCLDGDIEKVGDQYRIRRGTAETWVPVRQGLRLCKDWQEAYEHMKARANLADADERLRLARWCHLHDLTEQALAEAKLALEMRPKDPVANQWVQMLERGQATSKGGNVIQASGANPIKPTAVDLNADSVTMFTTRVQPILMNVCANCHTAGRGGAFQLTHSFGGGAKASTQRNLAAVLAQINVDQPAVSPLLVKAISAHDGVSSAPPLPSRQAVPFRALQMWVEQTMASNPHLRKNSPDALAQAAPPKRLPETVAIAPLLPPSPPGAKPVVSKNVTRFPENPAPKTESKTTGLASPSRLPTAVQQVEALSPLAGPNPDDPFDPGEFNRQNHSKK